MDGHYQILRKLAGGGMGEVYEARDRLLDRTVALKFLPPDLASRTQSRERLLQEARLAGSLNHPNIVTIYEVGANERGDYIAMEFVRGRTLESIIPPGGLEQAHVVRIGIQVADALAAAHAAGVIHRDLKPGNIMIAGNGLVKVLDFGLAKSVPAAQPAGATVTLAMGPRTEAGMVLGTPEYMSPEQVEGKPLDVRSDVFAFGLVLYEMLTGRRAFESSSPAATLAAVLYKAPEPLPGNVPSYLHGIVSRCLEKDPGRRFAGMAEAKAALEQQRAPVSPESSRSIAVLPFANLSGAREDEYFSDGLAEEIINALAQAPGLRVTARTSAFAFRGKQQDIREIAGKLGVAAVLEGSVRRAGNRVRVTAQLIDAADGCHLWSQRLDRQMTDIFDLQEEVAQAIASALRVKLTGPLVRPSTHNLEAYHAYLRGRYHLVKYTPESMQKAKHFFEQAIELDPAYAPAHVGLADFLFAASSFDLAPPNVVLPRALALARRAIQCDERSADAHATLGSLEGLYLNDWAAAGHSFSRAVELDPMSPWIKYRHAMWYLRLVGHLETAATELRGALDLDPLSPLYCWALALVESMRGRWEEAWVVCQTGLDIDPDHVLLHWAAAHIQLERKNVEEAVRHAERGAAILGAPRGLAGQLALAYVAAGRRADAERLLQEQIPWGAAALVHYALGNEEESFACLERSVEAHEAPLFVLLTLRGHPRIDELRRKLNLK